MEGQPGIVANQAELIELVGKSINEGGVGSSRDGGVNDGEGDRTIVVNKDFEAEGEIRVSFPQNGGGQVGQVDADKITFRVDGRHVPGGVESSCSTHEGSGTLG